MAIENTSSRPPGDLYRQLLDSSTDPIFCFTPDCRYRYANLAFADGIGRSLEEIVGRTVWEVFPGDEADKRASLVRRVFDQGEPKAHEMLVQGRNGTRHYLTTMTPIFNAHGEVTYVLANSKDITIRKEAEGVLKASEAKYRALVETAGAGYLILDGKGRVVDANSEYVRLSGHSDVREILGRSVLEWTAEYEKERNDKAVAQCARDGFIRNLVIDYVDRNGQTTPVEIDATVSGEGDSLQIISLCRDITERKQLQDRILRLALHDPLTQLPNRTLFFDRFSQAVALARRNEKQVGLLFLDFDGFKPVNDRYGHDAGDHVLRTGADRLLAVVRGIDTVARLGGDEFGIILGELDGPHEAVPVAAKVLAALAQPIALSKGRQASVSASIGISMHPVDGSEVDILLDRADAAMYQSKHCGGNRFTFWGSSMSGHSDEGPWLQLGPELLVGVDEIDLQHGHLIDLGNRLHDSITGGWPRDAIKRQLADLIDYVKFHFLTECRLMQRYGYPGKPLHEKAHASLLADASQFDALLDQGGDRLVLHLIKDWLVTHIETQDKALGEFLNQTGRGETVRQG